MIPCEHILRVMEVQEAAAAEPSGPVGGFMERSQLGFRETFERCGAELEELTGHFGAGGVLETIQELGSETGGFVETEAAGLVIGALVRINALEEAVDDADRGTSQ